MFRFILILFLFCAGLQAENVTDSCHDRGRHSILDLNGDGRVGLLQDGISLMYKQFGFTGEGPRQPFIYQGIFIGNRQNIDAYYPLIESLLDIDNDGMINPMSDGFTLLMYLAGFRGEKLLEYVSPNGTRNTVEAIESYIQMLLDTTVPCI